MWVIGLLLYVALGIILYFLTLYDKHDTKFTTVDSRRPFAIVIGCFAPFFIIGCIILSLVEMFLDVKDYLKETLVKKGKKTKPA